ncbi:Dienelactone hydrolase [Micromonospora rhizosphaerae]|uniref:Dienelactone hydrolase n=1 Tax=Micromonospora rhizosphaerae TaxID=568872 RepID=A0A1C6RUQ1_9ACTN|nr:alpha/beta fold hydrolase [Micromonospora rhizosphaerae]SCL20948.1 Dienelactone hydrolase [Micromonospora rhizosphaerae]
MSAPSPGVRPAVRRTPVLAVLALLAVALGGLVLVRAGSGLTTRQVTVAGVPLTEIRATPASADTRRPGVVIAHGFAGSARLMRPIADTVARHGGVAVLLDFAGHGANPARLPGAGRDAAAGRDTLERDLDVAVAHLRTLPDVDPDRIVLVGHSMGAGAVTRYAGGHPEIAGTVAISLPDAADLPYGRPRSLVLVVGDAEFPDFRRTAEEAVRRAPAGARRLVVVPGTEHISVLFAGRTHDAVLGALPGAPDDPRPEPAARLVGGGLLLVGFGLGFVPLVALLFRRPSGGGGTAGSGPRGSRVVPAWSSLSLAVLAAGPGAVVAGALPTARLPLAVGGYVTGFLLVTGLLLAAAHRWRTRRAATGPAAAVECPPDEPVAQCPPVRTVVAVAVLSGYALVAVAVPIHLGLTSALPVGARWWLLPLVALGCLVFLLGAELAARGRAWVHAAVGATAVLALTASAMVGLAPGFVVLVVPLFALLLGWQAAWAVTLRRAGAPRWLPALVGAVLLAWPLTTTLPLT